MQYLPCYSPVYDQELSEIVSYSFVIIIIAVHLSEQLNNYYWREHQYDLFPSTPKKRREAQNVFTL